MTRSLGYRHHRSASAGLARPGRRPVALTQPPAVEVVQDLATQRSRRHAAERRWHLSGSHFRDYHLLFDEQAAAILGSIDGLAERVRRIGGTTVGSISHISQLQTISDDNDAFVSASEMVQRLLADNRHMAEQQRVTIVVCDQNRDAATSNLLQGLLDETERRIWFLFEIAQGLDNTA